MITSRSVTTAQWIVKVTACLMVSVAHHHVVVMALDFRAEHSIPAQSFQEHFDQTAEGGYHMVSISGFDDANGNVFFNTIWHKNIESIAWKGHAGIPESDYQAVFDENIAEGFRPVFVDGYSVEGIPHICAIYHLDDKSTSWTSRTFQSSSQYFTHYMNMLDQGFSLDVVSSYQNSGDLRIASLFSQHSEDSEDSARSARHGMTSSQYQAAFDQLVGQQGYSLQHVSVGTIDNDEPRFAAIFEKGSGQQFRAFHDVAESDIQTRLDSWITRGFIPKVIDCYRNGIDLRWALLFVKEEELEEQAMDPKPNDATFPETACFDEKITSFLKSNIIPGAGVSVMKDGKIVYSQGYGTRDVPGISGIHASSRKVSECTPFRLASVSKPVTSLAVLRLVQGGTLSLTDKVFGSGGILQRLSDNPRPCCPIVDNRIFDVTIYHLLTHSGGWDRDTTFDPMFRSKIVASTLGIPGPASCENIIYYMFNKNLQHTPGTTYAYSNFGYCLLGRIIEETTGLDYEEAVRQLLLDPAGISRDEMYVGSTQLENIPEMESEYYCRYCGLAESVFPTETSLVPFPYGAWYLEAMDAHGAWVASAPQLMKLVSMTGAPHCNGTLVNENTEQCLLWGSSIDELVKRPSFSSGVSWYGLGFSVRNAGSDHNWWHTGSLQGTKTILVRTNTAYGYAWTILVNTRGFSGSIDSLMWDAVGCVGNNWPEAYETTCDIRTMPDPNLPSKAPVIIAPTNQPSNPPVSSPPSASPSFVAPIPEVSNEPTVPPLNVPSDATPMPNRPTAFPTETRYTVGTNEPSATPSDDPIEDQFGNNAPGANQSNSKSRRYPSLLVFSLMSLLLRVH